MTKVSTCLTGLLKHADNPHPIPSHPNRWVNTERWWLHVTTRLSSLTTNLSVTMKGLG
jgi:hypothetical protein